MAFILIWAINSAYAGVAVGPLEQRIKIVPGGKNTFYINCVNIIREKQTKKTPLHLSATDFVIRRNGNYRFPKGGTTKYSACRWIKIENPNFSLAPGERRKVRCEIPLPRGARGEYVGAIMVDIGSPIRKKGSTVAMQMSVASIVYADVIGRKFPKRAEISELKVFFHRSDPAIKVVASLENKGRVSFKAQGEVKIMDKGEKHILEKFFLEPTEARIFPEGIRDFTGTLRRPLPAGEYVVKVSFKYGSRWKKARKKSVFSISPAFAQVLAKSKGKDSLALLDINPRPLKMDLYAGSFRTAFLKVFNRREKSVKVNINVKDEENWVKIYPSSFSLKPYYEKRIRVSFHVPSKIEEGKYPVKALFEVGTSPVKKIEFPILVRVLPR